MSKISGHVGAAPPGPKQNQMPINHKRSVKVAPTVNSTGGRHPAARRALSPKASARAAHNTSKNSDPLLQDSALNQANAMNQDAPPPSNTAADIAMPSSLGDLSQY